MDIDKFKRITKQLYKKVIDEFDKIDPDEAEANYHLDNISITFGDGTIFVINRQPPVYQLWLATKSKGYHFLYNDDSGKWLSTKTNEEFYLVLKTHADPYLSSSLNFN
ncbi:MAG: iron donor protein CyaY [SAR324 cluster bacterium]|nr:iron donor protein CyaY [SAR324 cluster bacterium]